MRREVDKYGSIHYYDGQNRLHRIDGPAIEYVNGDKYWYLNGNRHRVDGPAIEFANEDKCWYLNDKEYTYPEWDRVRKLLWLL